MFSTNIYNTYFADQTIYLEEYNFYMNNLFVIQYDKNYMINMITFIPVGF